MINHDKSFMYKLRLTLAHRDFLRTKIPFFTRRYIDGFKASQCEAARRLQGKEKLDVAFFLTTLGMWKVDYLFKAMQQSERFHPYIVIYPYSQYKGFSKDEIFSTQKRTEEFVKGCGYEYVIPYDEKTGRWLDVKKTLHPDIVFFSSPYKDHLPQYYIYHFRDTLTCYVPYGFYTVKPYKNNFDLLFHNLVGLHLLETEWHKMKGAETARNGGYNLFVTGYPGTEVFLREDYVAKDVWKPQPVKKKRLIWAPHHPVDDPHGVATFLQYHDVMLHLAEKYKDWIQIAFKPHQLLKFKLSLVWGQERVDEYYNHWNNLENGQLVETSYVDLFLTSDAMVHDCGSFTTEYIFTRKPVMYLVKTDQVDIRFNEIGKEAFYCHYQGENAQQIEQFITDVLLKGNDTKLSDRDAFYEKWLAPKDGLMPSRKVIQTIEYFIKRATY